MHQRCPDHEAANVIIHSRDVAYKILQRLPVGSQHQLPFLQLEVQLDDLLQRFEAPVCKICKDLSRC